MEENIIQLKEDNILRIGIQDAKGKPTGEHLEFDLEDIELPSRLEQCYKEHNENMQEVQRELLVLSKKQDGVVKDSLFTKNQQEQLKILKKFYEKEEKCLDLFLGENGTKKLLNGRKPYIGMFADITEMLEPIYPKLQLRTDNILKQIKSKYGKEDNNTI